MRLNIGCGTDIKPGWVNIDAQAGPGVDMVLDLEGGVLPFPDDSVAEVYCAHVLEHLWEWERVVLEIFRVLRPGGICEVRVPKGYTPCAYHVRTFEKWTLDWFLDGTGIGEDTSLEPRAHFELVKRYYGRKVPFSWHIQRYLGLTLPLHSRFGVAWEIVWILRKPKEEYYAD